MPLTELDLKISIIWLFIKTHTTATAFTSCVLSWVSVAGNVSNCNFSILSIANGEGFPLPFSQRLTVENVTLTLAANRSCVRPRVARNSLTTFLGRATPFNQNRTINIENTIVGYMEYIYQSRTFSRVVTRYCPNRANNRNIEAKYYTIACYV